ncbi:MAG: PLP-dependent transferase [Planctomycetota bacterium]
MHKHSTHGRFETRAIHAGQHPDPQTGAVTPVYLTSTTTRKPPPVSRSAGTVLAHNPTRTALQDNHDLESGRFGLRVVGPRRDQQRCSIAWCPVTRSWPLTISVQGTTASSPRSSSGTASRFVFVDGSNLDECVRRSTARPLRLHRNPDQPPVRLTDIAACAEIAHKGGGAKLVVDNAFATPYLQRPLEMGADIVLHSLCVPRRSLGRGGGPR